MSGVRVLVSGMGGELGSRVASLLEGEDWVAALEGIDVDPPRRRLERAVFHRIVTGDHDRVVEEVTRFDPHVVVHIAVWEPFSRANPRLARYLTDEAATSILGAAAECPSLESIVVRSGIEIYGRARGAMARPDETARVDPTSDYGRMVAGIEETARRIGERVGVTVGALRLGTVLGPHVPSPLGRVLRAPVVPFHATSDPAFTVVGESDAAAAFVAAARRRLAEPVNVVAPGSTTALRAIRHGRRIPAPLWGPGWVVARGLSWVSGAPVPEHVVEMLQRGRLADGGRAEEVLGFRPETSAGQIVERLYGWPSIIRHDSRSELAA